MYVGLAHKAGIAASHVEAKEYGIAGKVSDNILKAVVTLLMFAPGSLRKQHLAHHRQGCRKFLQHAILAQSCVEA